MGRVLRGATPWALTGVLLGVGCSGGEPTSVDSAAGLDSGVEGCVPVEGEAQPDAWGADSRVSLEATGFFAVGQLCERWWLVSPEGHPFWSLGVNAATPDGDKALETEQYPYGEAVDALYDSDEHWAEVSAERLQGWGFNTAGAWSRDDLYRPHMAVAPILYLSGSDWLSGEVDDWFDPAWEDAAAQTVEAQVAAHVDDAQVLGWFVDNEIRWGPDWRGLETLLQLYLGLEADAPGKAVAVGLLLGELGDIHGVNAALGSDYADADAMLADTGEWGALRSGSSEVEAALTTAFLELAAERYFSRATQIVRAADPNHLLLGNREVATLTRPEIWQLAGQHFDVVSVNHYQLADGIAGAARNLSGAAEPGLDLAAVHELTGKPLLISEFGFRADDAGLPNSWPPIYPTYETQTERTAAASEALDVALDAPWIVGMHWFKYQDQPVTGRFDGEDNNWGLVGLDDAPWPELTSMYTGRAGEWRTRVEVSR